MGIFWVNDDGGRAAAGYKGDTGDCAARALSIATGMGYKAAYDLINEFAKIEKPSKVRRGRSDARTGVHRVTMQAVMAHLGWRWVPLMKIGSGCTVHLHEAEVADGRIIVSLSKHYAAVINKKLHDTHRSDREGTRCVYGYWTNE